MHSTTKAIELESIIGANARLERSDIFAQKRSVRLLCNRALAWKNSSPAFLISATLLPAIFIFLAHLSGYKLFVVTAIITLSILVAFLYISCRVISEKGVYFTTDTIIRNFYRFLVERIKNFHYLYKERKRRDEPHVESVELLNTIQENRE